MCTVAPGPGPCEPAPRSRTQRTGQRSLCLTFPDHFFLKVLLRVSWGSQRPTEASLLAWWIELHMDASKGQVEPTGRRQSPLCSSRGGAVGMQGKDHQIWLLKRSWGATVLYKNLLALFLGWQLIQILFFFFLILRGPNRTVLRARYGLYAGSLQTLLCKVLL